MSEKTVRKYFATLKSSQRDNDFYIKFSLVTFFLLHKKWHEIKEIRWSLKLNPLKKMLKFMTHLLERMMNDRRVIFIKFFPILPFSNLQDKKKRIWRMMEEGRKGETLRMRSWILFLLYSSPSSRVRILTRKRVL